MPKKQGINTKAVEAKLRKETAKKQKEELIQKQKEDEYWRDDDKLVNRKLERQQQREAKKQEQLQRKQQNRQAYEEELKSTINSVSSKSNATASKVTRSQIQRFIENTSKKHSDKTANKSKNNLVGQDCDNKLKEPTHLEVPLVENINRMKIEGDQARNIDEAITILNQNELDIDRHPERRMRAAWLAYEERHLPRLKQENPTLRLSQLKEMLKKEFQKSSDNPINQVSKVS